LENGLDLIDDKSVTGVVDPDRNNGVQASN
jgi:hypothetical protein